MKHTHTRVQYKHKDEKEQWEDDDESMKKRKRKDTCVHIVELKNRRLRLDRRQNKWMRNEKKKK